MTSYFEIKLTIKGMKDAKGHARDYVNFFSCYGKPATAKDVMYTVKRFGFTAKDIDKVIINDTYEEWTIG